MNTDRLTRALTGFIQRVTPIDYLAFYPAKVVSQDATDFSLDVIPDDVRIPSGSRVPLRLGVPGVTAKVSPGSRVLIFFEGGNPSGMAAALFQGSTLLELVITANTKVTVNAPDVRLGDGLADVVRYGDVISLAGGTLANGGGPVSGTSAITLGTPQVSNPVPTKVKA